jgi:hypothetical protein
VGRLAALTTADARRLRYGTNAAVAVAEDRNAVEVQHS